MAPERELHALRHAAGLSRLDHVRPVRFRGDGAFDLVDALVSSRLFVRENELIQTLLLDPDGRPFADAMVAQEEDALLLLAEGPSMEALLAHARRVKEERCPRAAVDVEDLSSTHGLYGLDGPYAWELASEALGPDTLGLPYLSFVRLVDSVMCLRAGKTGEYGYLVLAPGPETEATWSRLREVGARQGAIEVGLPALDFCALENWHFSMRLYEPMGRELQLTPLEFQLQWRVDAQKDFVGAPALKARRVAGPSGRVTCFTAGAEVSAGQPVRLGDARMGTVLVVGWSPFRREWVGWAHLDLSVAWPGISALEVEGAGGPVAIDTRSPPLLNNRSLHIDPHRHSHQTRDQDEFPPLVVS